MVNLYKSSYGHENLCTIKTEQYFQYSNPRLLKRSAIFQKCIGWNCQSWTHLHRMHHHYRENFHFSRFGRIPPHFQIDEDYADFHEPAPLDLYPLNTRELITCGILSNVNLPLTFSEKLTRCEYCTETVLELKQLNSVLVPYSAFSEVKEVTDIHLNNLGIRYVSPGAFKELANLKRIYLSSNNITDLASDVFKNNEKLTVLDLSHNTIREVNSFMLNEKKMYPISLNLSHNQIDLLEKQLFQTVFFNLSSLDLSYNKIVDFDIRQINSNISSIDLSHNDILGTRGCLYSIPKLRISHNLIKVLENDCSATPTPMTYLDISHNRISDINFDTFPLNFGIQTLLLQYNCISNISIGAFSHLVGLRTLNLSYNIISSLPVGSFENLEKLTELDISNNLLKRLPFNALHSLSGLTNLYIQNNMIVDFKYTELLKRFPRLHSIDMDNNNFTCDRLMENVFYLETKLVIVVQGSSKYQENIQGIACRTKKKKLHETEPEKKFDQSHSLQFKEGAENYYQQVTLFWVAIVILGFLLVILAFQTYVLYYKCHFTQFENVEML